MRITDITEAHHAYDEPTTYHNNQYQPMRNGDTVRVFHGYRDFPHAVEAAKYGLSGATRAARVYSYERDNNPKGLFVTLSPKVAGEFVGGNATQAIIEFNASLDELEAPVWPGGSYTVQGQLSQYFGHGAKGRATRADAARAREAEIASNPNTAEWVKASDRKNLVDLLTQSREHQALFIGHLDASQIVAWHVRPQGPPYDAPYERITPQEFLSRYGETKLDRNSRSEDKLFAPNETFTGEALIQRLRSRFGNGRDDDFFYGFVKDSWERIKSSSDKMSTFREYYDMYLWPKQMVPCLQWMRNEFK